MTRRRGSDEDLVTGDERAFEELISRRSGAVHRLVTRMLAHSAAIDDVVQEALVRAWRAESNEMPPARTALAGLPGNYSKSRLHRDRVALRRGLEERARES